MGASWLLERMAEWGPLPAMVWAESTYTYDDLLILVTNWRVELHDNGVGAGTVVMLEGTFSPNSCALLLALLECDAVAVPLTPQASVHRDELARIAETQIHVAFDGADCPTMSRQDTVPRNPLLATLRSRDHAGLVIFSSGSTGVPKGVLHDFSVLAENYRVARRRKCTVTFLLFDHIGGIDTMLNTFSSGGTMVTLQSREPDAVCAAIATHRVHTLPTSPTFLNLLLISESYARHDLTSLKVIAYGTEPMPESTLQRLNEAFPAVSLVQTYGLSELGVLRSRSKDSRSLWLQFLDDDCETKVVASVLWVRMKSAMLGYLNEPELVDEDGWLNTEDAVETDGDYIRILGRASELINVGGQKVYPAEVEAVLLQMANVRDIAVYAEPNALVGQIVAARVNLIEPETLDSLKRRLRAFARQRLEPYKIPVRIEIIDGDLFNSRFKKVRTPAIRRESTGGPDA
jgi:long-chain acyl-CoA synthetase